MKTVLSGIDVYLYNCRLRMYAGMQYRADFLFGIVMTMLSSLLGPMVQYFIVMNTKGYPGWNLNQIMLFQGVALTFMGMKSMLFGDIRGVAMQIAWKGDLDRYLLKPYSAIVNIWGNSFQIGALPTVLCGLFISIWFGVSLKIPFSGYTVLLLLLCVVAAMMLCAAIATFLCGIVIMFVRIGRIWETFDVILRFGNYPLNIYPKKLELFFSILVPIAFMAYFPVQIILGNMSEIVFAAFIGVGVLLFAGIKFWNFCMKKYTSAGG